MVKKIRRVFNLPLKVTKFKLKNSCFAAAQRVESGLQGGIIRNAPIWYDAIKQNPPSDLFCAYRAILPEETGSFYTRRVGQRKRPNYITKPQAIVYPEDKVRDTFYASHPFELSRPRSLLQYESSFDAYDWSKNIYGNRADLDVCGENVVQRTMYLATQKPLREAYEIALEEFYAVRSEEEEARARVIVAASKHGASVATSLTALLGGPLAKQNSKQNKDELDVKPATAKMHFKEEHFMKTDFLHRKQHMQNRRQPPSSY